MPEVTLVVGRSLRIDGLALVKGEPQPITEQQAENFRDNPRLYITGSGVDGETSGGGKAAPQTKEELLEAIRSATGRLDVDDAGNWDERGLPKKARLKAILGYELSNSDIVKAVGKPIVNEPAKVKEALKVSEKEVKKDTPPPAYKPPVKAEPVKPVGGKIKIKKPAAAGGDLLDTGAGADGAEGGTGEKDPTTDGAMEA